MNIPKVTNMESPRTGRPVANQYIINIREDLDDPDNMPGRYFQSYDSIIAWIPDDLGKYFVVLDEYCWDYSRTTLKYLTQFLRDNTALSINYKRDIEKLIDNREILLDNLN